tara:strand:- start:410 stop:532 length:123 start_codon:yes stop_codon:yes gene_type:complete
MDLLLAIDKEKLPAVRKLLTPQTRTELFGTAIKLYPEKWI